MDESYRNTAGHPESILEVGGSLAVYKKPGDCSPGVVCAACKRGMEPETTADARQVPPTAEVRPHSLIRKIVM